MPFASINSTKPRTNWYNFHKKYWELAILKSVVFLSRPFWKKINIFPSFPWKQVSAHCEHVYLTKKVFFDNFLMKFHSFIDVFLSKKRNIRPLCKNWRFPYQIPLQRTNSFSPFDQAKHDDTLKESVPIYYVGSCILKISSLFI